MQERHKIAHLLRRFGLGAGKFELERYAPLGLEGAISSLIDYDEVDEEFEVSPWEFAAKPGEENLDINPPTFGSWWAMRMGIGRRPLQERLTLFWHDHFAVSAEKVGDGPAMLDYLQKIRANAAGDFRTLLGEVSKSSAMLRYLDTDMSDREMPNENFSRELFELLTMGEGSGYTERDIREAARAFTGWDVHYRELFVEEDFEALRQKNARKGRSIFQFAIVPDDQDNGAKTVLGKTGAFSGDDVLDLAADRPETARYITGKLWDWFAHIPPSAAMQERLQRIYFDEDKQIRPILKAIATSDEFYSEECVRSRAKSPVDFTVATFRQLNLHDIVMQLRGEVSDPYQPMSQEARGIGDGINFLMIRQGLFLLYPPDVGGWPWDSSWITSENMLIRIDHANLMFEGDDPNRPIAQYVAGLIAQAGPRSAEDVAREFLVIFDADELPGNLMTALAGSCRKHGGPSALGDKDSASAMLKEMGSLLFAAPEAQVC